MIDIHHLNPLQEEAVRFIAVGPYYALMNTYLFFGIFTFSFLVVGALAMAKNNARSLAELRALALNQPVEETSTGQVDVARELKEIKIRLDLMTEEMRSLRQDINRPQNYSAHPGPARGVLPLRYRTNDYPLPETRLL